MLQNVGPNIDYFPTLHQCQISARSYLRTRKAKVLSSPPPEKSPTDVKSWTKLFSQISRNLIPAIVEGTLNTIPLWFISGASQSGCSRFSNWTLKPLRNKMRRLSLALYNRWAIFFHETAKERHVHTCIWRNIVTSRLSPKKMNFPSRQRTLKSKCESHEQSNDAPPVFSFSGLYCDHSDTFVATATMWRGSGYIWTHKADCITYLIVMWFEKISDVATFVSSEAPAHAGLQSRHSLLKENIDVVSF